MTRRIILPIVLTLGAIALYAVVGCTAEQVERNAAEVQYVAGGTAPAGLATTQPGAGHDPAVEVARAAVQVASSTTPAVAQIASLVALAAGAVAGIAGHINGKRSSRKQAHTVVSEIIEDVALFRRPDVPWTESTRKLLQDLGYSDAATPAAQDSDA